jgi:hypothetical protein
VFHSKYDGRHPPLFKLGGLRLLCVTTRRCKSKQHKIKDEKEKGTTDPFYSRAPYDESFFLSRLVSVFGSAWKIKEKMNMTRTSLC